MKKINLNRRLLKFVYFEIKKKIVQKIHQLQNNQTLQ